MAFEGARRRKLAELMPDHIFCDIDRQMPFAVVDAEGQANHIRRDRRTTRPGLDRGRTRRALADAVNGLLNALVYERTFFN